MDALSGNIALRNAEQKSLQFANSLADSVPRGAFVAAGAPDRPASHERPRAAWRRFAAEGLPSRQDGSQRDGLLG